MEPAAQGDGGGGGVSNAPPSVTATMEKQLRSELEDCFLKNSSWACCAIGVLLAVPIGIRQRSLLPLVFLGGGGTLLDLAVGYKRCSTQREALNAFLEAQKQGTAQSGVATTEENLQD
eukprot:jgi/Chlat1/6864/Chrsp51S06536